MVEEWIESSENKYYGFITSGEWTLGDDMLMDFKHKFPGYGDNNKMSNKKFYSLLDEYARSKYGYYMNKKRSPNGILLSFHPEYLDPMPSFESWWIGANIKSNDYASGVTIYNDFKLKYPEVNISVNTFYKMIRDKSVVKFGRRPVQTKSRNGLTFIFVENN